MVRWGKLLLAAGVLLLGSSCVGVRQINELAIVTAVGLDVGKKPNTVRLSAQIIRPADARGQTGAPSGGTGEPIYSVETEGASIFDAIRNLGRFSSRRVYWAHNFLIVMHEDYARQGIQDMVDFFTRNHELRMNTWVAVTPDSPAELISTITGLEVVPGEAVDSLFRSNHVAGLAPGSNMRNLEESFLSVSTEPILAKLMLRPRGISNKKPEEQGSLEQVELGGAAVFKEGKMLGWLTPMESRALLMFREKLASGIETLPCPGDQDRRLTMEFKDARMDVDPGYSKGDIHYRIRVKMDASIVESGCAKSIASIREEAEALLAAQVKKRIERVVERAQREYRSDFLKLGEVFRNSYPVEWRGMSGHWSEVFSEAETKVEVSVRVNSAVLKAEGTGVR
ncbi:Ger(x)C family spore germination protein [Cohnella fermenti]|uniref:Ger(X)C family spore germination protein n=1 Tax=Cohnella fermenti TaxID=2565925 RepID=A0A4S4BRI3_9BACL|nr:Ger(x)C family spore germination protein [Cohnella fermenti]